jgi:CubicO group peptidase (beta-lactamase class C family)
MATLTNNIKQVINQVLPKPSLHHHASTPHTLRERMAYYHTPGVSVAVINNFEVEWARGFGFADADSKTKVSTRTMFQAGSISKAVAALVVMRLVENQVLSLDADVSSYLSSWQVPSQHSWRPKITLRQLLSHTAGLTVHGFLGYQTSEALPSVVQVLNGEWPANTPPVEADLLPGLQYRYSGGGTTVIQQLLEDVMSKPFPELARKLVFAPLDLKHSTYEQPPTKQWLPHLATAHPWKGIAMTGKYHIYPEMAAAGLWTNALDLATLGAELLSVLKNKPNRKLLGKETLQAMLLPQLRHQKIGDGEYVGLGFFCNGQDDTFYFGHDGWDEGFVADLRLYKNAGKGAVVMLNSNEGAPLLDEIMRGIAKVYDWPGVFAAPKVKPLKQPNAYAGRYVSPDGADFRIIAKGKNLSLEYGNQAALPLFPISDTEFFAKATNTKVVFRRNKRGSVTSLTVQQDGYEVKARRRINRK